MKSTRYEKEKKTQKEYNKTPRGIIACQKAINNHLIKSKEMMKELKLNGCSICGYNKCNSALAFHHVEQKEKKYWLNITFITGYSNNLIIEELDKCILLCENCHREVHENERRME